jgi:hypothetical protein
MCRLRSLSWCGAWQLRYSTRTQSLCACPNCSNPVLFFKRGWQRPQTTHPRNPSAGRPFWKSLRRPVDWLLGQVAACRIQRSEVLLLRLQGGGAVCCAMGAQAPLQSGGWLAHCHFLGAASLPLSLTMFVPRASSCWPTLHESLSLPTSYFLRERSLSRAGRVRWECVRLFVWVSCVHPPLPVVFLFALRVQPSCTLAPAPCHLRQASPLASMHSPSRRLSCRRAAGSLSASPSARPPLFRPLRPSARTRPGSLKPAALACATLLCALRQASVAEAAFPGSNSCLPGFFLSNATTGQCTACPTSTPYSLAGSTSIAQW